MKKLLSVLLVMFLAACTNAGPFVTNISSDGHEGLVIEKCQVHMNAFMGTVSNDNCTTSNIYLNSK